MAAPILAGMKPQYTDSINIPYIAPVFRPPGVASEVTTLREKLGQYKETNQRSIDTLEWFVRHIGLEPPTGLLVEDVINAGLEILSQRKR